VAPPLAVGSISPGAFIFILAVSAALAMLVFNHANRHGSKHATAWGIFAFFFGLLGLAVYAAHYLLTRRRY
jgi:hypothetical protein